MLVMVIAFFPDGAQAQTPLNLDAAVSQAKANNLQVKAGTYQIQVKQTLRRAAYEVPKTSFDLQLGQYNSNQFDQGISIRQEIPNPRNKKAGTAFADANIRSTELSLAVTENELVFEVRSAWFELAYLLERERLLVSQDSLLADFVRAAEMRLRVGESGSLERATAVSQSGEVLIQLARVRADIEIAQIRLQTLLNAAEPIGIPTDTRLERRTITLAGDVSGNPALTYFQQQIAISEANVAVEKARRAPDFSIGYVNQSLITEENAEPSYSATDRFHVVQAGVAIPIFGKAQKARIEAAQLERQVAQADIEYRIHQLEGQYRQALHEYEKQRTALEYFEQTALPTAELLLNNAQKAFRSGDVNYLEYVLALTRASEIKLGYLKALDGFNEAVLVIEFLTGK